jgi:hypothetical protein
LAVDSATTIAALNTALPTGADPKSEGDDNFRHIKTVIKAAFPNVAGAVSATDVELSRVAGVTSAIQTQLDAKAGTASPALTGTPTVPTATAGTSSTQAASTAFVQAAIAGVNAQTGALVDVRVTTASYSISNGQRAILEGAFVQTVTAPAYSDDGRWGIKVANGRADNVINWNSGNHEGLSDATMTIDRAGAAFEVIGTNSTDGWGLV